MFIMGGVARVTTVTFTRVPLLSKIAVNCTKLTVPVATDMLGALSAPDTRKLLPQPLINGRRNRRNSCANRRRLVHPRRITTTDCQHSMSGLAAYEVSGLTNRVEWALLDLGPSSAPWWLDGELDESLHLVLEVKQRRFPLILVFAGYWQSRQKRSQLRHAALR